MKVLILSDLHTEFYPFDPPANGYDAVIIAGDIAVPAAAAVRWACRKWPPSCPVLFVPGNHEFYDQPIEPALDDMRHAARDTHVHALDCDEVVIAGVRFLGCTLWSDFAVRIDTDSGPRSDPVRSMNEARPVMNDYRLIWTGRREIGAEGTTPDLPWDNWTKPTARRLTPEDTVALHREHREWLAARLATPFDGKTVVITHFAPHRHSLASKYAGDWASGAFVNELPKEFFTVPCLWAHGHTHTSFDYRIENCRVVCNPRGYMRRDGAVENNDFNPSLILEI